MLEQWFADIRAEIEKRLQEADNDFYAEEVFEFEFGDGVH